MPFTRDAAAVSLVLSVGVILIAVLLGVRQRYERRHREPNLSPEDATHFGRQDVRRWAGAVVMVLLAVGIAVGSRVPPEVAGRTNVLFLQIWLGSFVLLLLLLGLALFDWVAIRIYARRHSRRLTRERIEMLRDEARRRSTPTNGRARPQKSGEDSPPSD